MSLKNFLEYGTPGSGATSCGLFLRGALKTSASGSSSDGAMRGISRLMFSVSQTNQPVADLFKQNGIRFKVREL
jgi:hypothetical protein